MNSWEIFAKVHQREITKRIKKKIRKGFSKEIEVKTRVIWLKEASFEEEEEEEGEGNKWVENFFFLVLVSLI